MMLLPTWELTKQSVQTGHDFATTSEGGMAVREMLGVVLPALTDHCYVGALTLSLAPLAFLRPTSFRSRWFFLALAVLTVLMMAGANTPLYRFAYTVVPGVSLFRDPTRYSSLYGAALAALAAAGLDALVSGELSRRARVRWAMATVFAAAVAIVLGFAPRLDTITHGAGLVRAGGLLAVGVAVVLAALRVQGTSWQPWALSITIGGLCAADLFPYLVEQRHTRAWPVAEGRETEVTLRALAPELAQYRTYDEFGIGMRSGSRYGQRDLRGYQDPLSIGRYQKVLGLLETTPSVLAMFNVRWVLYGPHYAFGDWHHFLPNPAVGSWAVQRGAHIWELPNALPDAFWMDGADIVSDKDIALERLAASAPSPTIVMESADVEGLAVPVPTGAYIPCEATVLGDSVTVAVDAPRAGFVVVNEVYYPGWVATVDGAAAPIRRANVLVRAVWVEAGKHRIVMQFRPWQPRVLEPLALAALALLAGGVIVQAVSALRQRSFSKIARTS